MNEQNGTPNRPVTLKSFLWGILREIVAQRKWILLPFWILLAIVAAMFLVTGSHMLLPAIYIAF